MIFLIDIISYHFGLVFVMSIASHNKSNYIWDCYFQKVIISEGWYLREFQQQRNYFVATFTRLQLLGVVTFETLWWRKYQLGDNVWKHSCNGIFLELTGVSESDEHMSSISTSADSGTSLTGESLPVDVLQKNKQYFQIIC